MTQYTKVEHKGWERFLGSRLGGFVAYSLGIVFVAIVLISILELLGVLDKPLDFLPLAVKLPIVLCTPAIIWAYRRGLKGKKNTTLLTSESEGEKEENPIFLGFVLLEDARWDKEAFINRLKEEWDIRIDEPLGEEEGADNLIYVEYTGMRLIISLIDASLPQEEVEHYASANYLWEEAVEVVKRQKAHLLISVMGDKADPIYKGFTFSTLVATALAQDNALAVYSDGMVYAPEFYREVVREAYDKEDYPLLALVWFGIGQNPEGQHGFYTYGLRKFGKEEIEIYSDKPLEEIRAMLYNITYYVLDSNVVLQDGETIGLSAEQKLQITYSAGICLEGQTLKIVF